MAERAYSTPVSHARRFLTPFSFIIFISNGATAFAQSAQQPVALEAPPGKELFVQQTFTIIGHCGSSTIGLTGFSKGAKNFLSNPGDAQILVKKSGGRKIVLGGSATDPNTDGPLQDYDGIACVHTASGIRLVVWENCAGSLCGDQYSFLIIDAERALVLEPKNPKSLSQSCDESCASNALDSDFPHKIDAALR